jgi:hypothetical protein
MPDFRAYSEQGRLRNKPDETDVTKVMKNFEKGSGPVVEARPLERQFATTPPREGGGHTTYINPKVAEEFEKDNVKPEMFDLLLKHEVAHTFFTPMEEIRKDFEPGDEFERLLRPGAPPFTGKDFFIKPPPEGL